MPFFKFINYVILFKQTECFNLCVRVNFDL